MDISRAVDEVVSFGIRLFHRLQAEGQGLSKLELHILAALLQVLQTETTRLGNQQSRSLKLPQSAVARLLRVFDHHSLDLYRDKELLLRRGHRLH